MGEFETSPSCSSLLCEDIEEACFFETGREDDGSVYLNYFKSCFVSENEDEYIEKLVERDIDVGFKTNTCFSDYPTTSKSWLECARLNGFSIQEQPSGSKSIQLICLKHTLISFFLKRSIDDGKLWAVRLLSVACLSLAAKMEECRVPIQDYQFDNKVIKRMELLVLSTLEWKMGSIIPFAYLHYFISKFYGKSRAKRLLSKAVELIVAMVKDISLLDHRQSIIAAAASLAASDGRLTRKAMELKMDFISLWESLENEQIFSCYNMMQEIEMRKSKTPKFVISSNYSSHIMVLRILQLELRENLHSMSLIKIAWQRKSVGPNEWSLIFFIDRIILTGKKN